ncbi:hypothetical protein KP509_13G093500, partial [Ceratopteris richardii]
MKKHAIGAVREQAAELRANLCAAINKSLLDHLSGSPTSPIVSDFQDIKSTNYVNMCNDLSVSPSIVSLAESRSLASIRDGLIVLEEQLECLQCLPDQEKEQRKATLAELEESRQIILRRLKHYRGRKLAIIQDALSFVGKPNENDDYVSPKIYPRHATRIVDADLRQKIMEGTRVGTPEVQIHTEKGGEKQHGSEKVQNARNGVGTYNLLNGLKRKILTFVNRRVVRASAKCLLTVAG